MTEQRFENIEHKIDEIYKKLFTDNGCLLERVTRLETSRDANKSIAAMIISLLTLIIVAVKTFAT